MIFLWTVRMELLAMQNVRRFMEHFDVMGNVSNTRLRFLFYTIKDFLFRLESVTGPWITIVNPHNMEIHVSRSLFCILTKMNVMEWGDAENVRGTFVVQLDHLLQHKLSTSQYTRQTFIQPSCTVSVSTAKWLNDNLFENRLSRADFKPKIQGIRELQKLSSVHFIGVQWSRDLKSIRSSNLFCIQMIYFWTWFPRENCKSPQQTLGVYNVTVFIKHWV